MRSSTIGKAAPPDNGGAPPDTYQLGGLTLERVHGPVDEGWRLRWRYAVRSRPGDDGTTFRGYVSAYDVDRYGVRTERTSLVTCGSVRVEVYTPTDGAELWAVALGLVVQRWPDLAFGEQPIPYRVTRAGRGAAGRL